MTTKAEWELATSPAPPVVPPTGLPGTASDRILAFCRSPRFKAWLAVFASRGETLLSVVEDVRVAFDLPTAVGVQLDRLGGILGRARDGKGDADYRLLLQIHVEIILSKAGTIPTIKRIIELYTGTAPTIYKEVSPMSFVTNAGSLTDAGKITELVGLLREATAAAYGFKLVVHDGNGLTIDSSVTPIVGAKVIDSSATPIAGAGTIAGIRIA